MTDERSGATATGDTATDSGSPADATGEPSTVLSPPDPLDLDGLGREDLAEWTHSTHTKRCSDWI